MAIMTESLKLMMRGKPSVSNMITRYRIKHNPNTTYLSLWTDTLAMKPSKPSLVILTCIHT
jgi:hypothetical protein